MKDFAQLTVTKDAMNRLVKTSWFKWLADQVIPFGSLEHEGLHPVNCDKRCSESAGQDVTV
jgi:hypothetical protein